MERPDEEKTVTDLSILRKAEQEDAAEENRDRHVLLMLYRQIVYTDARSSRYVDWDSPGLVLDPNLEASRAESELFHQLMISWLELKHANTMEEEE